MSTFWATFASNAVSEAADIGGDMVPVIAVIAGLAIAATVVQIIITLFRGR